MITGENIGLPEDDAVWKYIITNIRRGSIIPVISNSLRLGHLFSEKNGNFKQIVGIHRQGRTHQSITTIPTKKWANKFYYPRKRAGVRKPKGILFTIDKVLTEMWANEIQYPLQDKYNLARVAQFWQVENPEKYRSAKEQYLDSLKIFFLNHVLKTLSARDGKNPEATMETDGLIKEVSKLIDDIDIDLDLHKFSELVVDQLSLPKFPAGIEDPLRLIARLNLPIYITTSYFDFLERILRSESNGKKEPRTQVCFCTRNFDPKPEHEVDYTYTPEVKTPAVYHLYGLEDYPESLVLSEDDYLNFLISMFEDTNKDHPLIPLTLQKALATSPLLLLGFQLHDWDFRVLFRFLLKFRKPGAKPGLIIQLNPSKEGMAQKEKSVDFLNHYFDKEEFNLLWEDADSFIQKLYLTWNNNR